MRIFIGLVTPDGTLRNFFGAGKDRVLPRDGHGYLAARKPSIVVGSYVPQRPSAGDLEKFLLIKAKEADGCLLLIDKEWQHLTSNVRNATFSAIFDRSAGLPNYQNFFRSIIAKLLRAFGALASRFRNGDDMQLLALPLRNFQAPELAEIARFCREDNLQPSFNDSLQGHLSVLGNRCRPRRRSSYKTIYIVDDMQRFFSYGHEIHAQFETGNPHRPHCALAGHFRFGNRIPANRHYNVSETEKDETSIDGKFFDCHDACHVVGGRTHLNMFSNDFF